MENHRKYKLNENDQSIAKLPGLPTPCLLITKLIEKTLKKKEGRKKERKHSEHSLNKNFQFSNRS